MRNKSYENWEVGCDCLKQGRFNAAASRLYYGVFQAVLTYAREKKNYVHQAGKTDHAAMANIVWTTGKACGKYGRVFNKMMSLRETSDYERETPTLTKINEVLKDSGEIRNYFLEKAAN